MRAAAAAAAPAPAAGAGGGGGAVHASTVHASCWRSRGSSVEEEKEKEGADRTRRLLDRSLLVQPARVPVGALRGEPLGLEAPLRRQPEK